MESEWAGGTRFPRGETNLNLAANHPCLKERLDLQPGSYGRELGYYYNKKGPSPTVFLSRACLSLFSELACFILHSPAWLRTHRRSLSPTRAKFGFDFGSVFCTVLYGVRRGRSTDPSVLSTQPPGTLRLAYLREMM